MFDGSMAMSLNTLNCPSYIVGGRNYRNSRIKSRALFAGFSVKSSILLPIDGNGHSSESKNFTGPTSRLNADSILSVANTIGIIGGASAASTVRFLKKLVVWSSKEGEESLPFIVCNDPTLSKELWSCERGSFSFLSLKNIDSFPDRSPIVENLRHKRTFLEQSGARCIVMPCHISHSWHADLSRDCPVPFFHVGECVAKELKEAKLKPIVVGSSVRVGILATVATLKAGVYQEKLQDMGFEVVLPDKATMEHTIIPAIEALNRKDMEGAKNLFRIALQVLLVRAVNTIILASDDMQTLLPPNDPLLKKCIDPMDALARSTIKWAESFEKL